MSSPERVLSPSTLEKRSLSVGDRIHIQDRSYTILRVDSAYDVGKKFGLYPSKDIPVYWLDSSGPGARGAYVPSERMVLFFTNTDESTQAHELVHAIEFFQDKSPGLVGVYEEVLLRISEDSFEGGGASFNFRKNIHEFIADGITKPPFIAALRKEGLYDRFIQESAYLFV